MKNVFVLLASGKSSRFGGYPKALCKVGDKYLAQATVSLAAKFFDETCVVLNKETYLEYKDALCGCKTLAIETGQGEAHSFLRAARLINASRDVGRITLCWGDTFFLDSSIFEAAAKAAIENVVGVSLSSIDSEPYAWYETEGDKIRRARFRGKDGAVESGIHDQSVFVFDAAAICAQLESYMTFLGLNDAENFVSKEVSKEMRLLDSFGYFYNNNLLPMKYCLVEAGRRFSFNTQEELESLRQMRAERGN